MKSPEVTIRQVSMEWLGMKKLVVKQSTYAKYESIVGNHIAECLGDIPLCRVNSAMVNAFAAEKMGIQPDGCRRNCEKGVMCAKTVRDICTILKSIIRYGENEYHLQNLVGNTVLPRAKAAEKEILNVNEVRKFERYLRENQDVPRCAGLLLCLYTGMRLGEICALKWTDIDLKTRTLCVSHTAQRIAAAAGEGLPRTVVITDFPKTDASKRVIPIPDIVFPLIRSRFPVSGKDFYFLTNSPRLIEPRNYQYFFEKALERAGVRRVNFHILRHTFASRCVEAGMDVKTLSEILGHSSTGITLNYYVHSSMESKKKQLNRLRFGGR